VRLPTAAAIADNAARVAAALCRDPRPAVVIAHSKGGLETLAALTDPAAARHCAALVAIQSPFLGSPVADFLVAAAPLRATVSGSLRLLRAGSGAGLRDLTTASRRAWMSAHESQIARLTEHIPIVCCATRVSDSTIGPDRRYLALARWMERQGFGPNDGMVPVSSALLPGARHVVIGGGHRGAVSKGRGRDPVGLLRRLMKLALMEPRAAVDG
jgi:type VI protein secretion system component VasA